MRRDAVALRADAKPRSFEDREAFFIWKLILRTAV